MRAVVLVTGASGGVGLAAFQIIRLLGAHDWARPTSAPGAARLTEFGGEEIFIDPTPFPLRAGGLVMSAIDLFGSNDITRKAQAEVIGLVEDGRIDAVVDWRMPLAQTAEAHRLLESRRVRGVSPRTRSNPEWARNGFTCCRIPVGVTPNAE